MPELTQLTSEQWNNEGPQTPALRFFAEYHRTVDRAGFNEGSGAQFYADDMVFHNQNNAEYHGGDQMWAWMKAMFNQFGDLKHDILGGWEIKQDDGSFLIFVQITRKIWANGNTSSIPDVSAPMFWRAIISKSDDPRAVNGLQYKEVWIWWDTALLTPILSKSAVVFSTENVIEN